RCCDVGDRIIDSLCGPGGVKSCECRRDALRNTARAKCWAAVRDDLPARIAVGFIYRIRVERRFPEAECRIAQYPIRVGLYPRCSAGLFDPHIDVTAPGEPAVVDVRNSDLCGVGNC